MTAPVELQIALDGGELAARSWGDASLPTLLAIHGWLDNADSFALLAPLLADRFRVVALDLPGHGHSAHLPAGASYHYSDYVQAVLSVANALSLDRYQLLGHSLGAGVASLVAAALPSRLEQLWLIEGLGPIADDGSHTLQRFREAMLPPTAARRPLRIFRDIEQAVQARCLASGMPAELARPIVERGLQRVDGGWCWRSDPRLTGASAVRMAESQVHALLRGIATPTSLLLSTPTTAYLPDAMMQARADCVTDIRVSHLDGGHHLHLQHPQTIADWIAAGRD
jgi:pimeloyl-ACP methyl ester carboxylesterase